jgi:exonuclease SbcC
MYAPKRTERRDMLERIFYLEESGRELQEKLARRMGRLKSLLDKLSGELKGYEDADDQALEQAKSAMEEAAAKRNEAVLAFSQTEKRYQEAKVVWELVQEYEAILEQEQAHESLREGVTLKRSLLDRAVRADSLRDAIEQVRGLEEASRKAETEVTEMTQRLVAAEAGLKESREGYDALKKEAAQEQPRLIALKARLEQALVVLQDADRLKRRVDLWILSWVKSSRHTGKELCHKQRNRRIRQDGKGACRYGDESAGLRIDPEYRQRVQTGLTLQQESAVCAKEAMELERKAQTWQGAVRSLQMQMLEITEAIMRQQKEIEGIKAEQQSLIDRKPEDRTILAQKNERLYGLKTAYSLLEVHWNAQKELKKKQAALEGELDILNQRLAVQIQAEKAAMKRLDSCREDVKHLEKVQVSI